MKFSVAIVIIAAAAFTGPANAAETTNGNLRATSLQTTEVFEDAEPIPLTPREILDKCLSENVLGIKKPKAKTVAKTTTSSVADHLKENISSCYDEASNGVSETRSALTNEIPESCALECAKSAATKFKPVSPSCEKIKSLKDLKCADDDDECKKDQNEIDKCNKEISKAQSSFKKVAKAFDSCNPSCTFVVPPETESEEAIQTTDVFEEHIEIA